jgi:beta-lactam-binding protein with PASTA domain
VLSQPVRPGARIGVGSSVTLTVASGPRTESVVAADYVGQPVATVVSALRAKNLVVRIETAEGGGRAGTVLAVMPSGSLHEGDVVTVVTAGAPRPEKKKGHDGGGGDG